MTLQELFTKLSRTKLSNLSLSNNGDGTIVTASQPKIVEYVNEALLKLYTRFVLREDEVILLLQDQISLYRFLPKYSLNYIPTGPADDEPIRYIFDLPDELFLDEFIKVITVFDSYGCRLPVNDEGDSRSVFTPSIKTLQVPAPVQDMALNVRYQRQHPKLQGELSETIDCPDVLLPALTSYVAFMVFNDMNSDSGNAKAQTFLGAYEATCSEVVDRDLVGSSTSQTSTRFHRGGWI